MFELTVPVAALAAHLQWVGAHVPTRPAVPVLSGIRLTVTENRLALDATDYDTWASARMEAEADGAGTVVLPGRLLSTLVGKLPADAQAHLWVEEASVRLRCGPVDAELRTLAADEYPEQPEVPAARGRCEASDLAPALARVAGAACTDDTLPALTGVRMAATPGGLSLAATDRYRACHGLVAWTPTIPEAEETQEWVVPAAGLAKAVRGLAGDVDLAADDDLLTLTTSERTLMVRCLDVCFPKVDSLYSGLCDQRTATATVHTAALRAAIERVRLFAPASTPLTLHLTGERVSVSGGHEGETATETLPIEVEGDLGEGVTLGMNPGFLLGLLSSTRAERSRLALVSQTQPVIATGEGASEQDWCLLMPVRLTGR